MKILIITTSRMELEGILSGMDLKSFTSFEKGIVLSGRTEVEFHVCLPGIFDMSYNLMKKIQSGSYDFLINAGICGSFKEEFSPGKLVRVKNDLFADIGAWKDDVYSDLFGMGLADPDHFPFSSGIISDDPQFSSPALDSIEKVNSITVNSIPADRKIASKYYQPSGPDIESMEGAAFFYICRNEKLPCLQLRSVSNYVDDRDRSGWLIDEALTKLGEGLKEILDEL